MSEQTNAPVAGETEQTDEQIIEQSPFKHTIHIVRNGVTAALTPFVGKRGDWKGTPYAAFQLEENPDLDFEKDATFLTALKWIGKSNAVIMLDTWLKRVGQDNAYDSIPRDKDGNPTGPFDASKFKALWEELTAAGQRMSELAEQIEGEQKRFLNFVSVDVINIMSSGTEEQKKGIAEEVGRRKRRIELLRSQLETRKARYSKEKSTEEVRPS